MAFRDDKDALEQRLGDLEQDLKAAREGLDRKEEELQRLRARLGGLDKAPSKPRPVVAIVAAVPSLDFGRVAVKCGDAVLYDTRAPVRGTMMSQTSGSLEELPVKGGDAFRYRLVYQDVGTRTLTARPQAEIGTARRIARLFHEGALGGSLDLTIEPDSAPRTGDALVARD